MGSDMLERGRRRHGDRRCGDGVSSDHSDAAVVRRQVFADTRAWSVDVAKAAGTQTPDTRAVGVVPHFCETEDIHSTVTDALDNVVLILVVFTFTTSLLVERIGVNLSK